MPSGRTKIESSTARFRREGGLLTSDVNSPSDESADLSASSDPDLAELERRIGYQFVDRSRLLCALTHRSFSHEVLDGSCRDNESYEFLGDAILAFVVADRLFRLFPGLDEGRLSKHKSALEKSHTLAEIAGKLGLGSYLRLGRGERKSGGSRNDKILSDAVEAILAAIYLDGGLGAAEAFLERILGGRFALLDGLHPMTDYKSALQEHTQARNLGTPAYRVVEESGPDHEKQFRVMVSVDGRDVAEGRGTTKRAAHQVAARKALEDLTQQAEQV